MEVIGHRGNVSSFPENTIPGFESLIDLGADALELDLVISADKQVVVSHEDYLSADYMFKPDGLRISRSKEKDFRIYNMSYERIRSFRIGPRSDHKFPEQKKISAYKPLLEEVFSAVEEKLKGKDDSSFKYYLEIKSDSAEYGVSQPHPPEFVKLILQVVQQHGLEQRVIIKSFDANILSEVHKSSPKIKVSYLLYKTSVKEGLRYLNFKPDIISPYFGQLKDFEQINDLRKQNIKVIAWTVNEKQHIRKMIKLGVDGIISDYPEEVLKEKERRSI